MLRYNINNGMEIEIYEIVDRKWNYSQIIRFKNE